MIKQINTLLTPFLSQSTWKNQLLSHWPQIMGSLYHRVTLEKISDDTLLLGVYDSAWLQELYLLSPVILENINANLDQPRIKQLRFKQVAKKNKPKKKEAQQEKPSRPIVFTNKEEKALQTIDDEELRNALKNFLVRCYKENV